MGRYIFYTTIYWVRAMKILEPEPLKILIATHNIGKVNEFRRLLGGLPYELTDLRDLREMPVIDETGTTFEANARMKAIGYAKASGMYTIADDSGLEINALGGLPGVKSARFAGAKTGYDAKIAQLLSQIGESVSPDRGARFVSHVVFADPGGTVLFEAEGVCEGTIADGPRGTNGFGYDPVFVPEGFTKTFGELSDDEKEAISHRARAAAKIIRFLRDFA